MTWAMVGAAAITTVGGILGSSSQKKLQKEALRLQRDQLKFSKQRYNDYKNLYGGLEEQVVADAKKGIDPNLGQVTSEASADVANTFKHAREAIDVQNQRLGINPNSGRAESSQRQLGLGQALATAGSVTHARNTERRSADDRTWNRRMAVYQQGNNLLNNTANSVSNASSNLSTTISNNAAQEGGIANQALGMGLSMGTQGLLNYFDNRPKTTTTSINDIGNTTKGLKLNGTGISSGVLFDDTKGISPAYENQTSFLG